MIFLPRPYEGMQRAKKSEALITQMTQSGKHNFESPCRRWWWVRVALSVPRTKTRIAAWAERRHIVRKHLYFLFLFPFLPALSLFMLASDWLASASVHNSNSKRSAYDALWVFHMQRAQDKNESRTGELERFDLTPPQRLNFLPEWAEKQRRWKHFFVPESVVVVFISFLLFFKLEQFQLSSACDHKRPSLLGLVAVNVLQRFQLFNQGLVLVFQHGHAVFQTFDILFLFPAALTGCFPAEERRRRRVRNVVESGFIRFPLFVMSTLKGKVLQTKKSQNFSSTLWPSAPLV